MEKFDEKKPGEGENELLNDTSADASADASADEVVDVAIARMMSGAVVKEERQQRFKFIAIAALIITGLVVFAGYDFVYQTPDSKINASGQTTLSLRQGQGGHYMAAGKINGEPVKFLVDTGATDVAIPMSVAKKIGLPIGLAFRTKTANGYGTGYETRIKTIALGDIELTDVSASVSEGLTGEEILLGMSFLRKTKVETENGVMKITY